MQRGGVCSRHWIAHAEAARRRLRPLRGRLQQGDLSRGVRPATPHLCPIATHVEAERHRAVVAMQDVPALATAQRPVRCPDGDRLLGCR